METSILKKQIQSISDLSSIYLLDALSDTAGFFANNGKLLYIAKDIYCYHSQDDQTLPIRGNDTVYTASGHKNEEWSGQNGTDLCQ